MNVFAARWDRPDGKLAMFTLSHGCWDDFRYSPDSKWLSFIGGTVKQRQLMVMPVDPSLPHGFGPPILLRSKEEPPQKWNGNCAWISDPPAVVCRVQKSEKIWLTGEYKHVTKLLKWELSPANVRK
jgi:hypothetical protein